MGFDLAQSLLFLIALVPALTLHEFCHAYSAMRAGDPTPAMHGRVTLNPLAHLDPLGTLLVIFAGIGWAKPVPINPANFRHPSRDIIITSAAGPLSNLVQGTVWALILRLLIREAPGAIFAGNGTITTLAILLSIMTSLNFVLAIFNLIPLGPLDGHHILAYVLPYRQGLAYHSFNQQYGTLILIGLLVMERFVPAVGAAWMLIFRPGELAASFLIGWPT